MATPDLPAEAVEAVWSLFACRCLPAWTERKLHAPDCIQELGYDVLDIVAKACADERAQVLAEVDAALRDQGRWSAWYRAKDPDGNWSCGNEFARFVSPQERGTLADYLRDTLGAGGEGE